jgi:hypothetical protein
MRRQSRPSKQGRDDLEEPALTKEQIKERKSNKVRINLK